MNNTSNPNNIRYLKTIQNLHLFLVFIPSRDVSFCLLVDKTDIYEDVLIDIFRHLKPLLPYSARQVLH